MYPLRKANNPFDCHISWEGERGKSCHDVFCIWESVIGTSTGLLLRTRPRRSNTLGQTKPIEIWGIRGLEKGPMGGAVTNGLDTGKISKSHGLPQHLTHPAAPGKCKSRNVISATDIPYRHANFAAMRWQRNASVWFFNRKMRHINKIKTEAVGIRNRGTETKLSDTPSEYLADAWLSLNKSVTESVALIYLFYDSLRVSLYCAFNMPRWGLWHFYPSVGVKKTSLVRQLWSENRISSFEHGRRCEQID